MNIIRIDDCEVINGLGVGVTVFVAGCSHACKGCFNKFTWNKNNGVPLTQAQIISIINILKNRSRLTLSGGDPFEPYNIIESLDFLRQIKEKTNVKTWVYTGYTLEQIKLRHDYFKIEKDVNKYIDFIVDGEYKKDLKPLAFRGSSNQNIWENKNGKWVKYDNELLQ